jgi:6-phosphofructokinase 2
VVDSSGPALEAALAQGVDLFKPSLRERRELTGRDLADPASLVAEGKAKIVALTPGSQGAILGASGAPGRC